MANGADPDADMLKAAGDAVVAIDVRYRLASFQEKIEMRDDRDRAFSAYAMARNRLLAEGMVATDADVAEMREIAAEMKTKADQASLLRAIVKVVTVLGRFALV